MSRQPTVFLVDPDEEFRELIKRLTTLMDLQCEVFAAGQEFLAAFDPARHGCVATEVKVPGINGLQIQQRLRDMGATMPVIFISSGPSVSIAVHAMRFGALHFLEKPVRENELWSVIQEAIQLDEQRRQTRRVQVESDERVGTLNEKEYAVMEMIANGLTKAAIAGELGISVRTVEHYRTQLMRKLRTNSLASLMQFALSRKNGWPPPDGAPRARLNGSQHGSQPLRS